MLTKIATMVCALHMLIIFVMLFEYRCSRRTFITASLIGITVFSIPTLVVMSTLGMSAACITSLFTGTLPAFVLSWVLAKTRGSRLIFTYCFADTVSLWVGMVTGLLGHMIAWGKDWVMLLILALRLVLFPLLELVIWRRVRRPYLELQHTVEKGWTPFAAISMVYYLMLVLAGSYPDMIWERPHDIPLVLLIVIQMPLVYGASFRVLKRQQEIYIADERRNLLKAQSSMIEQRILETKAAEENLRIERHDLRHRLQAVAAMLAKDENEEALEYLGAAQKILDRTSPQRFCRNTVLDAILSGYIRMAEDLDVKVETRLAIPDELPFDAVELSTVFANALENSIHACEKLPKEERLIRCTCVNEPQFIFEISNPCKTPVRFGPDGVPLSDSKGHGIGTRSIVAFTEKHNALCRFKQEGGWFKLQIIL